MAAAAEMLGHRRDIYFSFAAQADAIAAIGEFAKKYRHLYVGHRERVVDQPFAIFLARAEALHLFLRDPDPGQRALAMQIRERRPQQPHLRRGMSEIN